MTWVHDEEMGFRLFGDFQNDVWHFYLISTFLNEKCFHLIEAALDDLLKLGRGVLDKNYLRRYLSKHNNIASIINRL
ncbi:hypothetical protein DCCM_3221 [Desulfocucumis palustris]|uniref:Uncharacterized protein n=1 Tax=Desulfocucumis palustris TaxID=1898651 RepID=A0A2L2XCP4_9FIRM|nr:hypothetical protein DCCM_3221 [Desulfocucumis palustris]